MKHIDALVQRLAIRSPIIQAPMVGASNAALAAAVTNAGGLGSIGLGASNAAQAREAIAAVRALTAGPFNVNLFCHALPVADAAREARWLEHLAAWFEEFGARPPASLKPDFGSFLGDTAMLEVLLEQRPKVVSFHFGLPPVEWIDALKVASVFTLATATSLGEAEAVQDAGVDAIVAQGVEAGGHRGVFLPAEDDRLGTFALVRLLALRCRLPVIAAGGVMDGAGMAAAFALGAAAVQMGTAFVACPESAANAAYRAALAGAPALHTRIVSAISGRPARGLPNRFQTEVAVPSAPPLPDYPITYNASKALVAAATARGETGFQVQWAGQGAPLARALPTAELVRVLVAEWRAAAASLQD